MHRETFALGLPQRISDIRSGWERVLAHPADAQAWTALTAAVHSLAGSAGSFGYARLGGHARLLELEIEARRTSNATPSTPSTDLSAIGHSVATLLKLGAIGADPDV